MERKKRKKSLRVPIPVFFVIAILLVVYFLPRESKFSYTYSINKPWLYGLLTAPFDFHILKSDEVIKAEQDSIMRSFEPYYDSRDSIRDKVVSLFKEDAQARSVPQHYVNHVVQKLNEVYKAGIISPENYERIDQSDSKQIKLKNENNVAVTRHISSFYTPRQAYEKILSDHTSGIDPSELKILNLNNYLQENITYDESMSNNVKTELLKQVIPYDGIVQAGEKIIDRGEIVDSHTFDILNSYVSEMDNKGSSRNNPLWLSVGQIIMVSIIIMALMVYLMFFRPREYFNRRNVVFILLCVTTFPILTAILVSLKLYSILYVIPFAIPTILVRTFIDSRTAMVTHSLTALICALMVPSPAEFLVVQLLVGYTCIFSLKNLAERSQLFYSALLILLTYIIAYVGWVLCFEGDIKQVNYNVFIYFCINFVFVTFAYLLVYVCERVFGFISDVSMIELSNINKPLLQKLSEVAPGTFQHSMQVANLVAAAAVRIGANPLLVRTGALYHDIGKMENPAFFTENQTPGMNPHAGLSYAESARIIISHVTDGIKIAKKYDLPQQIVDFIATHHGKGKVKYFYYSYLNDHPDEKVNEEDFTYPGPNPFSKEMALLMMADTVEAASKSLKDYTPESISGLVNKLIDEQLSDGLLRNAPITFRDVEIVKEVFIDKLMRIYHSRIAYPELKKKLDNPQLTKK